MSARRSYSGFADFGLGPYYGDVWDDLLVGAKQAATTYIQQAQRGTVGNPQGTIGNVAVNPQPEASMFDTLPSWTLPVAIIVGAIIIFR